MSVEGAESQVQDTDAREIVVPDLAATKAAIGTPEVFHTRTARELQQIKADPEAVPMAAREFSRTERLFIRVRSYGAGTSSPMLSVHLLNRNGDAMSEIPITASDVPGVQQFEMPRAGLAPGE